MIKAGIAGGIGSGKSGVARCFETIGIPVYYADDKAKKIAHKQFYIRDIMLPLHIIHEMGP